MEFSKKGRRAIVLSTALLLVVLSLYISLQLLFKTNELLLTILLLGFTIGTCFVIDLTVRRVMRTECPQCPLKQEDYTASQKEWQQTRQKEFLSSGKPFLFAVFFLVVVFGGTEGLKFLLAALKAAPYNVQFWSAVISPFIGCLLGIINGHFMCNRWQQYLSELMNVPEQEPVAAELQSPQTNLPPIPSPFKSP